MGQPDLEIERVALEVGADLIVMGVRGRGAVDLMLFGSTTRHVLREAGLPVLTVGVPRAVAEDHPTPGWAVAGRPSAAAPKA
jgi:nucleotide-binding universal stress UspA family protein